MGIILGALMVTLSCGIPVWAEEDQTGNAVPTTMEEAAKAALDDAGTSISDAAVYKQIWKYEDGMGKYEIGFAIPGQTKYEYEVDFMTGKILKNESEVWEAEDDAEYQGLMPGKEADPEEMVKALEKAKETAFQDAGLTADEVVVYKNGTDFENGTEVFVIDFFQAGKTKYEYDIAVEDGTTVTHEQEAWDKDDDAEYEGLLNPEMMSAKGSPEEGSGVSETEAQNIAVEDAGLSMDDVTVTKCQKDMDDGIEKYDVEFRSADGANYEYEIDAASGKILDKDMEYEDD